MSIVQEYLVEVKFQKTKRSTVQTRKELSSAKEISMILWQLIWKLAIVMYSLYTSASASSFYLTTKLSTNLAGTITSTGAEYDMCK